MNNEISILNKIYILKNLSNIKCINKCNGRLYVGQVSLNDDTPILFCTKCNLRISIVLKNITGE